MVTGMIHRITKDLYKIAERCRCNTSTLLNIIICLTVFLAFVSFSSPYYEENDDLVLNMISVGAFGEPSQYLIHTNIILGHLFKALYGVIPSLNWYLWFYLILNLLSIFLICEIITKEFDAPIVIFISALINLLLAEDFYLQIQYTKNAGLYVSVAFVILFREWMLAVPPHAHSHMNIIAVILFLFGSMARIESTLMLLPFGAICGVVVLVFFPAARHIRAFLPLCIAIVLCLTSYQINQYAYTHDASWRDYRTWNSISTQMRDYGAYKFDQNKDDFLEAGFSEADFSLLNNWIFCDTERFSVPRMQQLQSIGSQSETSFHPDYDLLGKTLRNLSQATRTEYPALIMMTIIMIALWKKNRFAICLILGQLSCLFAEYSYLTYVDRLLWRVKLPMWLPVILFSALGIIVENTEADNARAGNRIGMILSFIPGFLLLTMIILPLHWRYSSAPKPSPGKIYEVAHKIHDMEGFYLAGLFYYGDCGGAENLFSITGDYAGFYHNIVMAGGWPIPSPIGLYYAHLNGIDNPIRALAEQDDVFFVGGQWAAELLLTYMQENYDPALQLHVVENFQEDIAIYAYVRG